MGMPLKGTATKGEFWLAHVPWWDVAACGLVPLAAHKVWGLGSFHLSSQTFDAFLEPLAASFIRPPPQPFLSTLLLHFLTLLALVGGQTLIKKRALHKEKCLVKGGTEAH